MLTIAQFIGRNRGGEEVWTSIAYENVDGYADSADAHLAAMCIFEASRPWGGCERGILSSATEIAIREAA